MAIQNKNEITATQALKLLKLTASDAKSDESLEAAVTQRFRDLVRTQHPDKGGDPEAFKQLVTARDKLLSDLKFARRLLADQTPLTMRTVGKAWARAVGGL